MKYITYISLVFLLLILLAFRFQSFYQSHLALLGGEQVSLMTTLSEEPEFSNKGQKFRIKTPRNQLLYVTTAALPRYQYGQVLQVNGKLTAKKLTDGRTIFSLYHPKITVEKQSDSAIAAVATSIRTQTKMMYESVLPPISASLLMGMVFGAREQFPNDFWAALQVTGVLHVIAASGMNVTFISAAMLYTLGLFLRRQVALIIGSLGIIFYVFLVGFEPSILRASIMGILAFGSSLFGRQHIAAIAVFVSGYALLFWQPAFLFDVGFQLSFMATLGIIFIKPLIPPPENVITESFSTTLAAQLGTLPILFAVFGKFGLLSLLVNAIVLWTIPVVMLFGSIAAIVGLAIPALGQLFLYPAIPFLLFFEYVVSFFGGSNWLLHIPQMPAIVWIGYYLLLGAYVLAQKKKLQLKEDPNKQKSLFSDL